MQAQSILLFPLLFGLGFAAHFIYRMIMEKKRISKSRTAGAEHSKRSGETGRRDKKQGREQGEKTRQGQKLPDAEDVERKTQGVLRH